MRASLNVTGDSAAALESMPGVSAQPDPPTLRLVDIARLLNVSKERARQIAKGEDYRFPDPAITGPRRAWSRDDVEAWILEVRWWGRYRWRKPAEPS